MDSPGRTRARGLKTKTPACTASVCRPVSLTGGFVTVKTSHGEAACGVRGTIFLFGKCKF